MNLNNPILPGQTIGIIGGGQLGRMMAISAKEMGYDIAVLDPTPNSPCGQIADIEIVANYDDLNAIKKLAKVSDVITYEFENIDYEALNWLQEHTNLPQGSELLKITQDRGTEKKAITDAGIEVAPYLLIDNERDLLVGVRKLGLPCVLKTRRGGYDGKGQAVIKSTNDISQTLPLLDAGPCVLEAWIAFEKEVSVIVTRNSSGDVTTFPISENIHHENILHQSIVPARVTPLVEKNAIEKAISLANTFQLVGTLAVEMFVTSDEGIFINELAPRPHNSGHYTIEACETSQFDQHIRAICGLPLGDTRLLSPVVMVNILGEHVEPIIKKTQISPVGKLHLYGKKEAKTKRKMGHITILGDSIDQAMGKVKEIDIWQDEMIGGVSK